jgi:hypothetical protein
VWNANSGRPPAGVIRARTRTRPHRSCSAIHKLRRRRYRSSRC